MGSIFSDFQYLACIQDGCPITPMCLPQVNEQRLGRKLLAKYVLGQSHPRGNTARV